MSTQQPPDWVALVGKILTDTPKLDGAACVGHAALFDPAEPSEPAEQVERRHEAASRICRWSCPRQQECESWVRSLSSRERPRGVVAGLIPGDAPPGRPKKASA